MKKLIVGISAAFAASFGIITSAHASDWLHSGTSLTEQGTETPWVLKVSLTKNTTELSVSAVTTAGANMELDFSGTVKDADGTDYTIVSLDGFAKQPITKLVFPKGVRTTARDAFLDCKSLQTVTPLIPETITEFGQRTFAGCTNLEGTVVFPANTIKSTYTWTNGTWGWFNGSKITSCDMSQATMTEIVKGSFSNCKQLKWVKLPQGLTTIAEDAFTGSSALETIEPMFPDTVTSFGACPFRNCTSLKGDVKLTNENATVTFSHHGNNSYGIFQGCAKITSFEMTASIKHSQDGEGYVDNNMFNGCSSLGWAVLPANVKGLTRSSVFSGCTALTNVTFLGWQAPTSFGKNAFDGVTDKQVRVFYPRLSTSWEAFFPTLTGYTAMTEKLAAEYSGKYPGEILPLGCFKLYNRTVWISDLTKEDANSIYVIGSPVEANDENTPVAPTYGGYHDIQNGEVRTFAAPSVGVYDSGEYRCKGYELCYETDVRAWSAPVKSADTACTITQADDKVWRLTWLWGPNGYALNSTPMNDGGTVACDPPNEGLYAPNTVVTLTATPDTAGGYQFVCWAGADAPTGDAANNPVTTVTMDAAKEVRAVFSASKWTYDGNKTLSNGNWSLTVSRSGTELSVTAATAMSAGGTLDFSQPIKDADGTDYTIVSLDGFTKQPITKLVFPNGIRKTGRDAFLECTSLKTVTPLIPDTITEFGQRTFAGCTALEGDVVFPAHTVTSTYSWTNGTWGWFNGSKITSCDMSAATMTEIVTYSFANCSALKWVKLPQGLTKISEQAFASSDALETVEPFLPDTVNDLGACVFKGCKALKGSLRIANKEPVTLRRGGNSGAYQFYDCQSLGTVDISSPIVYQYNSNPIVVGLLVPNVFAGCSSLVSVTFPTNLTQLSDSVCLNCSSLTNVYFRGTVPTLGSNVFTGFPSGTLRVFVPKADTAWTKDFYEANVTPMNDDLKAAYEALYPGEPLPKGQFTWFSRKMWFCLWKGSDKDGFMLFVR